jgi:hypothetical protein
MEGNMNFTDWIPAISTTSLVGLALWLLRSVILNRLAKSVQHEFNSKIETLRANLRKSEESFKANLRQKETQIAALSSGALAGLANRQSALDKRRIEAVDQIWSAVTSLAPAKGVSAAMAGVKFDAAAQAAAKEPKVREMFSMVGNGLAQQKMQINEAIKARPFVSQIAWALFLAYHAVLSLAVMKLHFLKSGLDNPKILDSEAVTKLIQVALPHQIEYIKKFGSGASYYLLDELESRLLEELHKMLQGAEADQASVEQAAAILKEAERVMESISQSAPS